MKLRGKNILRIIFPFLCQAALGSNAGCGTLRFLSMMQSIFLFKKDALSVTRVVQLFLHFRLKVCIRPTGFLQLWQLYDVSKGIQRKKMDSEILTP